MHGFKPTSIVVDSPVCIGNWCPRNYGGGFSGSMTLTEALKRSINVVAVKLSIAVGNGNPKLGRAKIRETARKAGIRTPLPDTPSMPIGADEVTVLDHTGGYTMFPNLGKANAPHAVLEVRSGAGELIWRWDRDGKKPVQVIPPQVAVDMVGMMTKVVEEGTARRAVLDGIQAAGKTGTTNAYRDAWFVGYTGNFTCAVWFGNDDYSPTNRMTGGSLPAQTWHNIMSVAHQGIEIKEIAGIGPGVKLPQQAAPQTVASGAPASKPPEIKPGPPPVLTKRGADILVQVEKLLDDAAKAADKTSASDPPKPSKPVSSTALPFPDSFAAAAPGDTAPAASRKN